MKKKLLTIVLSGIILLTSGCVKTAKLQDGRDIVATMDGYNITAEDLYEELKDASGASVLVNLIDEFIANKEYETTEEIETYANNQLISIKAQYEAYGYDFTSDLVNAGYSSEEEFKEDIILDYKKTLVAEDYYKDNLSDDEINKYYEDEIYGELTVKHILITPSEDTDEAEEEALNKAEEVITKLNNEEITWADAVNEYSSDDANKENEGLLSSFTKQDVSDYGDDFFNTSLELANDDYSATPVKSPYGYHVILKVDQKEKPSLEDSLDTIKENLCEEAFADDTSLSDKLWIKIREKYNLKIEDTILNENYTTIKENTNSEE